MKSFKDLKPGDKIFVVQQKSRWSKGEAKTSVETVSKVGRKYAYYDGGYQEFKFCRETGVSVHSRDSNARVNGLGFDVYLSEMDWREKEYRKARVAALNKRLYGRFRLKDLPYEVVAEFHQILDEEGLYLEEDSES